MVQPDYVNNQAIVKKLEIVKKSIMDIISLFEKELKTFLIVKNESLEMSLAFLYNQKKVKTTGALTLTALQEFFEAPDDIFEEWVILFN